MLKVVIFVQVRWTAKITNHFNLASNEDILMFIASDCVLKVVGFAIALEQFWNRFID